MQGAASTRLRWTRWSFARLGMQWRISGLPPLQSLFLCGLCVNPKLALRGGLWMAAPSHSAPQRKTSAVPRSFGSGPKRFGPELLSRQ